MTTEETFRTLFRVEPTMTTTGVIPHDGLPSENPNDSASKRGIRLLWGSAALILMITVVRMVHVMPHDSQLDAASGVFSCLAFDFAHGEVYRPLYGSVGYGGTRYFPLHPACHAALMKLGIDPMSAGYVIAIAAGIGLIAGVYVLMRRLGVTWQMAAPCSVFVLCTVTGQWAVTTIRGDLLPATMNIWGLAMCAGVFARGEQSPRFRPLLPAIFFTLAFAGKMTDVFGAAALFWALIFSRRWKDAARFAGCMIIGLAIFFAIMQWASHGWFWKTMQTCADSDADLQTFSTAPVAMLLNTYRTDAGAMFFWLLAAAALFHAPKQIWTELPTMALLATAAVTVVIFGTPGTAINHLIDLHVIAIVFFVVQIARGRISMHLGQLFLALAVMMSIAGTVQSMRDRDRIDRRTRFASTLHQIRDLKGPVLFEIPTAPVIAGQRPYMSDPYMFAVLGIKRPEVAKEFLAKIDHQEFGAIICIKDPADPVGREWFDTAYFGQGFIEHVLANYECLPRVKYCDYIYVPRKVPVEVKQSAGAEATTAAPMELLPSMLRN